MQSSTYVLDMDLKNGPVQITNTDLKRTNPDRAVLDIENGTINDPNLLQFMLNVKSTVEPSVEEVLDHFTPRPLPPETPRRCSSYGTSASSAHTSSTSTA